MTPAGHLLSGYLVGEWLAGRRYEKRERRLIVATAIAGAIAPDADVIFGLLGGWAGASLHRSFSHSVLGAVGLGLLVAAVFRRHRRILFAAASLGVMSHVLLDALNVWGVQLLWPYFWYLTGNLIHERDLIALALIAVAALVAARGRRRAAAVWLVLALPAYLAVQTAWRHHTRELAAGDLAGRRFTVHPTGRLRCGWIALSAGEGDLAVHCATSPWTSRLTPAQSVPLLDSEFTRASSSSPAVREFVTKVAFPYPIQQEAADGSVLVIWRDLRETFEQGPDGVPTGIHVLLSPQGEILSESHRWWLKLW